ncbi:MAG TPA: protein-L-isoaspartate(D-aspartate) O-methyltransferase [Acidobacteriota bacterium]|nr:protein-L-isoaspartate(D-aspartate) O-methyltransferase [Acidobacteriota bacterium]HNT18684.1 protein-L-isoaspartate(D-aspartate) O-methyltransferase [Acidobacteriota bacterium]HPA27383.1 protein-L-isoaspartate(D-aspartate) O-methyltransferase [Acidobacteriota bacterium]HQO20847.1 protein-L-isoaspartate(D-aspartate) O-methyltransferase [Acidobacteriota bacterium]HQQ47681.1 protein-L-isoaspartate(D-aspartate) O-methyltransferase [Acidobacteriota bacterium]
MGNRELMEMLDRQIRLRGIGDSRVWKAFEMVDRANFVPESEKDYAYQDRPLSIGYGQTTSQPAMIAEMLAELEIGEGEKVLEVGAGSGYLLALLYRLGANPYGIERIEELASRINGHLEKEKIPTLPIRTGDGSIGWQEEAPFDKIIISAASQIVPPELTDQLRPGGTMVAPIGNKSLQRLTVIRKDKDGNITVEQKTLCVFVPLVMNTVI